MYQQSLPPTDDSPAVAGVWARGIAMAERPELADRAEKMAAGLVAAAVKRTRTGHRIRAEVEVTGDGLLITVRDPGHPGVIDGIVWEEGSTLTSSFGVRGGPDGHEAWIELRTVDAAAAV